MVLSSGHAGGSYQRSALIRIVPLEEEHQEKIAIHPSQAYYDLVDVADKWAVFYKDDIVAIGGGVTVDDAAAGWMVFTTMITPAAFLPLHRFMKRIAEHYNSMGVRLVIHADPARPETARWANLLGFQVVCNEQVRGLTMQRFER